MRLVSFFLCTLVSLPSGGAPPIGSAAPAAPANTLPAVAQPGTSVPRPPKDGESQELAPNQKRKARVLILDLEPGPGFKRDTTRLLDDILTERASRLPGIDVTSGAEVRRLIELDAHRALLDFVGPTIAVAGVVAGAGALAFLPWWWTAE